MPTDTKVQTPRTDEDYLRFDPFEGDRDVDVSCQSVKIVTARKEHPCWLGLSPDSKPHTIKPGGRARYEHALFEGEWCSYYVCLNCMDKWLDAVLDQDGNNAGCELT